MKIKFLLLALIFSLFIHAESWVTKIENTSFDSGLVVENKQNILIKNCFISNKGGNCGLKLVNCSNVKVENCKIISVGSENKYYLEKRTAVFNKEYVFAQLGGVYGIYIKNCKNVLVTNSEVLDVFGQGIRVDGDNNMTTSDITIDSNRIAYIYDDGIKYSVDGDQMPFNNPKAKPFRGGIVRNNTLHDIGLGVSRLDFARHGMYLKAADILVEGNTVYNCFYGSGISLRNAGIIRNNNIFNCAYACIAYHTQTITTESSKVVLIENNNLRQDYAMDFPMRIVFEPEKEYNHCVQGCIYIGLVNVQKDSCVFIKKCIVQNNTCHLFKDYPSEIGNLKLTNNCASYSGTRKITMFTINGQTNDHEVIIKNNKLIDERLNKYYFNEKFKADTISNIYSYN